MSWKVEKVSQNVDMDMGTISWPLFIKIHDSCLAVFQEYMNMQIKNSFITSDENVMNH